MRYDLTDHEWAAIKRSPAARIMYTGLFPTA
jgi:hypothetical protein